jgi:hypothetical protein
MGSVGVPRGNQSRLCVQLPWALPGIGRMHWHQSRRTHTPSTAWPWCHLLQHGTNSCRTPAGRVRCCWSFHKCCFSLQLMIGFCHRHHRHRATSKIKLSSHALAASIDKFCRFRSPRRSWLVKQGSPRKLSSARRSWTKQRSFASKPRRFLLPHECWTRSLSILE